MKTLNDEYGFAGSTGNTLIELVVVIAIIGILSGMSASFRSLRQRANEAVAIQDMGNNLRPAIESFRIDVGEFPANGYALLTKNPYVAGTKNYSRWASATQQQPDGTVKTPYLRLDLAAPPNPDNDGWYEDPWGKPYVIFSNSFFSCAVVSSGRDGVPQTTISTITATEPNRSTGRFSLPAGTDDLGVVVDW